MYKVFISFSVFLGFLSCSSSTVESDSWSLPGVWDEKEQIAFKIENVDTLSPYNVFINIRNTNNYRYNNLFLITSLEHPNGKVITDTLEYRMANPDGSWLGTGIGSVKENKLWYKEKLNFSESGTYTLYIDHAVRNNGEVDGVTKLEGITDVGYSIEAITKEL